jgi:hypothetical protein
MADKAGEDIVVGRTNRSEVRTILVASRDEGEEAPNGYEADYVLGVGIKDGILQAAGSVGGIDAINALGSPAGGPVGNGIVAQGLNGVVGYARAAMRNKSREGTAAAGVFGIGDPGGPGVHGECAGGNAGVLGMGLGAGPGVRGVSPGGIGVVANGESGVFALGVQGPGVEGSSEGGPGVMASSVKGAGVFCHSVEGPGIEGHSKESRGGVFQSSKMAQVWLVPFGQSLQDPAAQLQRSEAGELAVTITLDKERGNVAHLWFCQVSGEPGVSKWVQIA